MPQRIFRWPPALRRSAVKYHSGINVIACFSIIGLGVMCCLLTTCQKNTTGPNESMLYFNSFESPADTAGWHGITAGVLVDDPAPGAGRRSLHISGGCIQPAAFIQLPERFGPGCYRLSCWGRLDNSSTAGSIGLVADAGQNGIRETRLQISTTDWSHGNSQISWDQPTTMTIGLEIWIGGFVPAHMSIDGITVEKIR